MKMDRAGKHYSVCGNPDTERQLSHVLTQRQFLNINPKKTSLQTTIPKKLSNNEDTKRDLHRPNLQAKQRKTESSD